jgi:hypothetical protein
VEIPDVRYVSNGDVALGTHSSSPRRRDRLHLPGDQPRGDPASCRLGRAAVSEIIQVADTVIVRPDPIAVAQPQRKDAARASEEAAHDRSSGHVA